MCQKRESNTYDKSKGNVYMQCIAMTKRSKAAFLKIIEAATRYILKKHIDVYVGENKNFAAALYNLGYVM